MGKGIRLLALFAAFSFMQTCLTAHAQKEGEMKPPATANDLYRHLVDKTLIIKSNFGNNSIEYHAPDGRVLGYNWDDIENIRSCWRVINHNTVCYYYGQTGGLNDPDSENIEACWHYSFHDSDQITGILSEDPSQKLWGSVKPGNPRNLTDFGVKWTCGQQIIASAISKQQ